MKVFLNIQKSNEDKELDIKFYQAVEIALKRQKLSGKPVARFNETGAFLEYPDGTIKREN